MLCNKRFQYRLLPEYAFEKFMQVKNTDRLISKPLNMVPDFYKIGFAIEWILLRLLEVI